MSKEEKISLEKLKNMAYDINCIGAEYCKIDKEDMTCNKCLRCAYDTISNYIDKLKKEKKKLKKNNNKALDYIEENSFQDTTGVVLNLQDESYWELWKLLKGE